MLLAYGWLVTEILPTLGLEQQFDIGKILSTFEF